MAEITAGRAADFIIAFSREHGDSVSNLKLQKLLYYSQAWFLAIYDKPLFDERLEAWVHGPAVPPIYGEFKKWSWQPIDCEVSFPELDKPVQEHLEEIMDVYGGMSAYELERLTHSEDPWKNARGGISPDESSNAVISINDMKGYYRSRLNVQRD